VGRYSAKAWEMRHVHTSPAHWSALVDDSRNRDSKNLTYGRTKKVTLK